MKKVISFVLCLLVTLSLTACGSQKANMGSNADQAIASAADQNTETAETKVTETEIIEAEATETGAIETETAEPGTEESSADIPETETAQETESAESAPLFDTSWASNDFEMLIPELPFEGWTVKEESDTVYELEVIGLNTSAATNAPDSGEPDGADKDIFLEYLNTLPTYGFSVTEEGAGYEWLAIDPLGNEILFTIGDGGCWVTISKKTGNDSASSSPSANTESLDIPQLPDADWTENPINTNCYSLSASGIDFEMLDAYTGDLYAADYNIFEIVPYDGEFWEMQAEKNIGNQSSIINIQYNGSEKTCTITITN